MATELCGTIWFEKEPSKEVLEMAEVYLGSVFYNGSTLDVECQYGSVSLEELERFTKYAKAHGCPIKDGEIHLWEDEDWKYSFSPSEGCWKYYEQTFLCDVSEEELVEALNRIRAEKVLDLSEKVLDLSNAKESKEGIPTFEEDLPDGSVCEYVVYRYPHLTPILITHAFNEDDAAVTAAEEFGGDKDDYYAERSIVTSTTFVKNKPYKIKASTYAVLETNELGVQVMYPDGYVQTIACKPAKEEQTC